MKSILLALLVCVPILLIVLAAHLYPVPTRGAIYLAEWEYEMETGGVRAPAVIGDIRCSTVGTCPSESAAFTTSLRERFPAGTPEEDFRTLLIDQKFNEAGTSGAEFDWPQIPCVHSVLVDWTSDNQSRLVTVNGHYILRCPWPLAGADFLLYKPSFNDIRARRTDP